MVSWGTLTATGGETGGDTEDRGDDRAGDDAPERALHPHRRVGVGVLVDRGVALDQQRGDEADPPDPEGEPRQVVAYVLERLAYGVSAPSGAFLLGERLLGAHRERNAGCEECREERHDREERVPGDRRLQGLSRGYGCCGGCRRGLSCSCAWRREGRQKPPRAPRGFSAGPRGQGPALRGAPRRALGCALGCARAPHVRRVVIC